jgi:hypothetical protein
MSIAVSIFGPYATAYCMFTCTDATQNPTVDPVHVVQALVYTLLDVFDATRDLYETLTVKEQRDYEQNLRSKGYPASRRIEYVNDERLGSDEAIVTDKAVVTRQFDIGYQTMGAEFAMGDGKLALSYGVIRWTGLCTTTLLHLEQRAYHSGNSI